MPPKPNKEIIDLGVKYSPEFACFPFKVITGIYLKLMEKGVDWRARPLSGCYYGEMHKKILQDLGYDVKLSLSILLMMIINIFMRL